MAGVLLLFIVLGGGAAYGYYAIHAPQGSSARPVKVDILPGDSDTSVANRLQRLGLVHDTLLFRVDARLQGLAAKLRAGEYRLRHNMSIADMIAALSVLHDPMIHITIPEGWRDGQIAAELQRHGISGAAFLRAVRRPAFDVGFPTGRPPGSSLEGFLFPDTYFVPPHYSGAAFARRMVREFARRFTPVMRAEARRSGHSVWQIVTMASIVEREAAVPPDRPKIASVYYNRLAINMALDADPTIQYALSHCSLRCSPHSAKWWPRLTSQAEYQSVQSAYNTYLHPGLPPGPICNPGLASLDAALAPAHTHYYYFVAKGTTGYHAFARTLAQQQANIQKYGG